MRPGCDIPHELGGRVRDLAEQRDLTIDEAYRHVIERGLDAIEDSAEIQQ